MIKTNKHIELKGNLVDIIFDFMKNMDINLNPKELNKTLKSFLDYNNFSLSKSLVLKLIENKDFMSNLILLNEIETYLKKIISDSIENNDIINVVGIVSYIELETGFWGIKSDNENWNPIDFPDELKTNNLKVKLKLKLLSNINTMTMWGNNVEILNYEILSKE